MDPRTKSGDANLPEAHEGETQTLSCEGCRTRKLRCSRERPTCSHCRRLDSPCAYSAKRSKPGIKPGAIEHLNRRVDALEGALQNVNRSSNYSFSEGQHDRDKTDPSSLQVAQDVLKLIAKALQSPQVGDILEESAAHTSTALTVQSQPEHREGDYSGADSTPKEDGSYLDSRKRRRIQDSPNEEPEHYVYTTEAINLRDALPEPDLMHEIISTYFNLIQPWIPILHESRFRRRLSEDHKYGLFEVILHAIVVAALRFVKHEQYGLQVSDVEKMMLESRARVVLFAMSNITLQSLQALIIIAYDDIGKGNASKAWSIVGSLSRTVEYLQLSVEEEDLSPQPQLHPLKSLATAHNWTDAETRRRVFWSIFILDRMSSVMTGWSTSLTANDVCRRLPADGGLWHKEEQVTTPYFGIWDKSAGKIGNSIAHLPTQYPSDDASDKVQPSPSSNVSVAASTTTDLSTIGAFAYRVEATESLSRVTTYFLQQKVDFTDRQEVGKWLMRFKELDLRLVHWKMFLPQKWKDSNVSLQPEVITMDPNLTLAHITHNTSMILLHQPIAYPRLEWSSSIKLPSFCSAETCEVAATETAFITRKYLTNSRVDSPVASQFSFCVYISARLLLVHWRYYNGSLAPEFWYLVQSLDDIGQRWLGSCTHGTILRETLATRLANELRNLHHSCAMNRDFKVDIHGWPAEVALGGKVITSRHSSKPAFPSNTMRPESSLQNTNVIGGFQQQTPDNLAPHRSNQASYLHSGVGSTQLELQQQNGNLVDLDPNSAFHPPNVYPSNGIPYGSNDDLSNVSHALLGQEFMDMDRVISLDNMMFSAYDGESVHGIMAPPMYQEG